MRCDPRYVNAHTRQRAICSAQEAKCLQDRALHCPECGYVVGVVYSDSTGHIRVKCQKCKAVSILNLAYFRRQRQNPKPIQIAD